MHGASRSCGLDTLNRLDADLARAAFLRCCGARTWAEAMTGHRPFEDAAALLRTSEQVWWRLGEEAWLEAFAAHPRIGEQPAAGHGVWASGEQVVPVAHADNPYRAQWNPDNNRLWVELTIGEVIRELHGDDERAEYLYSVLMGKAT